MLFNSLYCLMVLLVIAECRPYTNNGNSNNIQVISRSDKKNNSNSHLNLPTGGNDSKTTSAVNPRTIDSIIDLYANGIDDGLDLLEDALFAGKLSETTATTIKQSETTTTIPITTTIIISTTTSKEPTSGETNTETSETIATTPASFTAENLDSNKGTTNHDILQHVNNLTDAIIKDYDVANLANKLREIRQENDTQRSQIPQDVEATTFRFDSSERQEEEEGGNAVAGLISQFLSGLSNPDGGVDIDAIVGLIGGLSVQREDGTYDFEGLTDLLMGFFGPESGSDFGAFLGGLLGAAIKGLARPPGPKGAGIFAGTVLNGILPAISAPPPPPENGAGTTSTPKPMLDPFGFVAGLLKTVLGGSSGGGGNGAPSGNGGGHFTQAKNQLLKIIFQTISTIFSVSASSSSSKKG